VEDALTVSRITRAMPMYQFVLTMALAIYVGFSRLHHLRFLEREPMLTGILTECEHTLRIDQPAPKPASGELAVPEPSSWIVFSTGLGAVIALRCHRRRGDWRTSRR
jgi:hypothetical protein